MGGVFVIVVLLAVVCSSTATFYQLGLALQSFLGNLISGPGGSCGSCPAVPDCRMIPAIVLGYCCGCAQPLDQVPMFCAPNLICPLNMGKLCNDYNYLMNCCC